jgi:hypothetical protein
VTKRKPYVRSRFTSSRYPRERKIHMAGLADIVDLLKRWDRFKRIDETPETLTANRLLGHRAGFFMPSHARFVPSELKNLLGSLPIQNGPDSVLIRNPLPRSVRP